MLRRRLGANQLKHMPAADVRADDYVMVAVGARELRRAMAGAPGAKVSTVVTRALRQAHSVKTKGKKQHE